MLHDNQAALELLDQVTAEARRRWPHPGPFPHDAIGVLMVWIEGNPQLLDLYRRAIGSANYLARRNRNQQVLNMAIGRRVARELGALHMRRDGRRAVVRLSGHLFLSHSLLTR